MTKYFVVGHYGAFSSPVHLDGQTLAGARSSLRWQGVMGGFNGAIYKPHPTQRGHMIHVEGRASIGPHIEVTNGGAYTDAAWEHFMADNWGDEA